MCLAKVISDGTTVQISQQDWDAVELRMLELEGKLERIRAEACLCRQDAARDRGAALDRIVDLTKLKDGEP